MQVIVETGILDAYGTLIFALWVWQSLKPLLTARKERGNHGISQIHSSLRDFLLKSAAVAMRASRKKKFLKKCQVIVSQKIYCMRAIVTRSLYIFYPLFDVQKRFLRSFLKILALHCKYIRCKNYSFSMCPVSHCNSTVLFTFNYCSQYSGKM